MLYKFLFFITFAPEKYTTLCQNYGLEHSVKQLIASRLT